MIKMRGKRVGVERVGRNTKAQGFLSMPDDQNSVGIIKYIGADVDDDLKIGQKVYFDNKRTVIVIEGKEILVMDSENIVARVEE